MDSLKVEESLLNSILNKKASQLKTPSSIKMDIDNLPSKQFSQKIKELSMKLSALDEMAEDADEEEEEQEDAKPTEQDQEGDDDHEEQEEDSTEVSTTHLEDESHEELRTHQNQKSHVNIETGSIHSLTSSILSMLDKQDEEEYGKEHLYLDDYGYEKIQQVYQKIQDMVSQTEQDGIFLNPIREEFSKLWEGMEASHDNELRLLKIDRELSANLSSTMAKTRFLIKLAEDDPELGELLGARLEKAWNTVDIGEDEEKANQIKIDQLKQDIFELNRSINAATRVEGQETMMELHQIKAELKKERDGAFVESNKLRSSLNIIFAKRQQLFEKKSSLLEKSKLLDQEFTAQNDAIVRETSRKERLFTEMEEMREKISFKHYELQELEESLDSVLIKLTDTEKAVRDQRIINEAATREAEFSLGRIDKLRLDFESQQHLVERMALDAYRRTQELRIKEEEVFHLKNELNRCTRQRSLNTRKVVTLQQSLATLEIERESLKTKISILEKDLEAAQKKLEENKKKVEELDKERLFVNRNLKRATAVTSEHGVQTKTHETAVRNLEQAVQMYEIEINGQKHTIFRLERERDFYSHEATKFAQQVAFKLSDIKKMDVAIFQFKKKLELLETQLKKTQQIYDVAIYDKGVFERTLRDTVTEILENNQKVRHLTNQVSSLRYQVNEKDEMIHREALRYDRILKETDFYSKESKRIQRMADDIQRQVEALGSEWATLGCGIAKVEGELAKQCYCANAAHSRSEFHERKLMENNINLRDTFEKWRELNSTVRIGSYHYRNTIREIRDRRLAILTLRRQSAVKMKSIDNHMRLRHEVVILENNIVDEKCMMNALREQMRHPINIHRWRILEANDPEAYELVQKINLLTKRLVKRNITLKDQTKQLNAKQTMYVEIRDRLQTSPGLETTEEVKYYQNLLVAKKQQLTTLYQELISAESQTDFYRDEVRLLHDKMMQIKKKYIKRLEHNQKSFCNSVIFQQEKHLNQFKLPNLDYQRMIRSNE